MNKSLERLVIAVILISSISLFFVVYTYNSLANEYDVIESTNKTDFKLSELCSIDKECRLIAEAIVYEARGESLEGQYAVASVIINRVNHKRFPNTIKEVVHQRHQFSYLADKHKQTPPEENDWLRAYEVAYDVVLNNNTTIDALFYLNPEKVKKLPKWAIEYQMISSIGNHDFYVY